MDIYLYNTLSGTKEKFIPIKGKDVLMYNCGPTVYGPQHIGNLSMFVFTDILKRALQYADFEVRQVINITDFGHLVSDEDEGEDKMTKGLKKEGLELTMENMKVLATKYATIFLSDIKSLNVKIEDTQFPYASDYIVEQKKLIETLEEKGFSYQTSDGIYFDTGKFPNYGKLGNINHGDESRIGENKEKKNQRDFALWKFNKDLGWDSKWGKGFPGWHIECSAMIIKLLGEQIDIHTGGIEHIPVHHNNEIAQSEAATGKSPFSRFWLHREHLKIDDAKISKSEGTVFYMKDILEHGIHPLSFRYWLLTSHYKTPSNFTWEAVLGAQSAFEKIASRYTVLPETSENDAEILKKFEEAISDDLNTPITIALLQEASSKSVLNEMDRVLGLNIPKLSAELLGNIPEEILDLKKERDLAREKKEWQKSDDLRNEIERQGYVLEDKAENSTLRKIIGSLI